MASGKAYPAELRERAVKMVFDLREQDGNTRGSIRRVGERLGINPETLGNWGAANARRTSEVLRRRNCDAVRKMGN